MKKIFIITILLSTLFFSCERYIDSRDPVRSLPEITIDTEASIDSVRFSPSGITFEPGDTIRLALYTSEVGTARISFTGSGNITLVDNGLGYDDIADDFIYKGGYVVPANTNLYNGLVSGFFTDKAGNNAPAVTSYDFLYINTPPSPVELFVSFLSGTATFSWTPSTTADFESFRLYRSNSTSVSDSDQLIYYGTSSGTRSFEYDPPTGTSYFRIYVVDQHGVSVGSNTVQIIN